MIRAIYVCALSCGCVAALYGVDCANVCNTQQLDSANLNCCIKNCSSCVNNFPNDSCVLGGQPMFFTTCDTEQGQWTDPNNPADTGTVY